MRSSVIETDPGFRNWALKRPLYVFVDGKPVNKCVTADEEEGFAVAHVTDEQGHIVIDRTKHETVKAVLRGKVEILERWQL